MTEADLFKSVEQARQQLTTLRVQLEDQALAPGSKEISGALRDLQAMLDKLQVRYGLMCEILERTNEIVFAGEREAATDHERMRSMATKIVIGEEQLRRSLAADLQSGLGQDIALAKMRLSVLRKSASIELRESLVGIEQLVERADRSLRSITLQISPPSLHDLGLVAALEWLVEDIQQKYGLEVALEDDDSPGVGDERIRVILFRAVRALLINAATHAKVHQAKVRLSQSGESVRITVEDSGSGFDMADHDRLGYGLLGIREQLKYIDGSMHITSATGRGTLVTLLAPASESAAHPAA